MHSWIIPEDYEQLLYNAAVITQNSVDTYWETYPSARGGQNLSSTNVGSQVHRLGSTKTEVGARSKGLSSTNVGSSVHDPRCMVSA